MIADHAESVEIKSEILTRHKEPDELSEVLLIEDPINPALLVKCY